MGLKFMAFLLIMLYSLKLFLVASSISPSINENRMYGNHFTSDVLVKTKRQGTTTAVLTPNSTVQSGIGCGLKRLRPNDIAQIQSNNFRVANYFNNDACDWKFEASQCSLSAVCPCFDIPASFECLEDYLKISDTFHYHQKFCGDNIPNGAYRSGTNRLNIRFRSNLRDTATGFTCFIRCTPPGFADQMPPNITCPTPISRL